MGMKTHFFHIISDTKSASLAYRLCTWKRQLSLVLCLTIVTQQNIRSQISCPFVIWSKMLKNSAEKLIPNKSTVLLQNRIPPLRILLDD